MKNLFLIIIMITTLGFAQDVLDLPGPHYLWEGDTLKQSESLISTPVFTGHWPYQGIWVKTTNPAADSVKYRIYQKGTFDLTDSFAIISDTLGNDDGTIIWITDTLWHIRSIFPSCAKYTKIYIGADDTDHGDRACIWIKVYLWYGPSVIKQDF